MLEQWSRATRMRAVLCLTSVVGLRRHVPLFKGAGGGAVVLREASEEGEEGVCVFGCDDCFDVVYDFDPACNQGGWWSVAGVDGPGLSSMASRFVRSEFRAHLTN